MPIELLQIPQQVAPAVAMAPDCTIRSIDAAYQAVRRAVQQAVQQPGPEGVLSIDCTAIEQADITFVQLLVSAAKTPFSPSVRIALHAPPPCVREALARSGIQLGNDPFFVS